MIRAFGMQFFKVNQFNQTSQRIINARKICMSGWVQQIKSKAEELKEKKLKDQIDKEMRWTKLYHFETMKYHSIVTRLKIYPFFTLIIGSPIVYVVEMNHIFDSIAFIPFLVFGVTGTATLSLYSKVLSNTIGLIYICKDNKNLQIGYIEFMGKQHFIETTVDEVKKWEKGPVQLGYYKTLKAIDDGKEILLKIPWNTGVVYNTKLFRQCFGK